MNRKQFIKRTVLGIAIAPFIPIWDLITQPIPTRIHTIVSNDPKEEKTITLHGFNEFGEPVSEEITIKFNEVVVSKFSYSGIK